MWVVVAILSLIWVVRWMRRWEQRWLAEWRRLEQADLQQVEPELEHLELQPLNIVINVYVVADERTGWPLHDITPQARQIR